MASVTPTTRKASEMLLLFFFYGSGRGIGCVAVGTGGWVCRRGIYGVGDADNEESGRVFFCFCVGVPVLRRPRPLRCFTVGTWGMSFLAEAFMASVTATTRRTSVMLYFNLFVLLLCFPLFFGGGGVLRRPPPPRMRWGRHVGDGFVGEAAMASVTAMTMRASEMLVFVGGWVSGVFCFFCWGGCIAPPPFGCFAVGTRGMGLSERHLWRR